MKTLKPMPLVDQLGGKQAKLKFCILDSGSGIATRPRVSCLPVLFATMACIQRT